MNGNISKVPIFDVHIIASRRIFFQMNVFIKRETKEWKASRSFVKKFTTGIPPQRNVKARKKLHRYFLVNRKNNANPYVNRRFMLRFVEDLKTTRFNFDSQFVASEMNRFVFDSRLTKPETNRFAILDSLKMNRICELIRFANKSRPLLPQVIIKLPHSLHRWSHPAKGLLSLNQRFADITQLVCSWELSQ